MNSYNMSSTGPATAAMHSADDSLADIHGVPSRRNSSPCASWPVSSSVLVSQRTVSCPRLGSLPTPPSGAAAWKSHPNFCSSFESTFSRTSLPSCCENGGSSFEPTTQTSSRRHSLETVRLSLRAKKVEKFVQARAAMKQRLVDYRSLCEQEADNSAT